jgi:hypothetical protein
MVAPGGGERTSSVVRRIVLPLDVQSWRIVDVMRAGVSADPERAVPPSGGQD